MNERHDRTEPLPAGTESLARGVPEAPPGTLFVLTDRGGVRVGPGPGAAVVVGRNEPGVDVCLGADDPRVSRRHALLSWDHDGWTLRTIGAVPIRFPGSRLLPPGRETPVGAAYTPLFLRTGPGREHLFELRVTGPTPARAPVRWWLDDRERLVLAALGRRYLRHEASPRPDSRAGAAAVLRSVRPDAGWTAARAGQAVAGVRRRLAEAGVAGPDVSDHDLLVELLVTTSLVPPDLRRLDHRTDAS